MSLSPLDTIRATIRTHPHRRQIHAGEERVVEHILTTLGTPFEYEPLIELEGSSNLRGSLAEAEQRNFTVDFAIGCPNGKILLLELKHDRFPRNRVFSNLALAQTGLGKEHFEIAIMLWVPRIIYTTLTHDELMEFPWFVALGPDAWQVKNFLTTTALLIQRPTLDISTAA